MIREKIQHALEKALTDKGFSLPAVSLEYPSHSLFGDYATNVALILGKALGRNPKEIAEEIVAELQKQKLSEIKSVSVAGAGFINIELSEEFLAGIINDICQNKESYGANMEWKEKKVMVEYTDPNPFKEFHIGHLMPNVIGEAITRLYERSGAEVQRVCYQGDVGLHVASAVWGMKMLPDEMPKDDQSLKVKVAYLGKAYARGAKAYKEDKSSEAEIREINKKIYDKSDEVINTLYQTGRTWSLAYFETIYERLGTKFDHYFFESEVTPQGLSLVKQYLQNGVFEESEGAIIFRGEKYNLHTRVFINKEGLPTYEGKELGLTFKKFEEYNPDLSIVITANEQNDYFRVLLRVIALINESYASRTTHLSHGILRLPQGKMSSRTGDVITAESLIADVSDVIRSKMKNEAIETKVKEKIVEEIAIGAIKFTILRQSVGKDIIFDFEKSLSFEGDSGPYLQYTAVRANSVLEKARTQKKEPSSLSTIPTHAEEVARILLRFPEIVMRAGKERAPQLLVTYLLELAASFNAYYAANQILDDSSEVSARLSLVEATRITLTNGLSVLGIPVPVQM